MLAEGATLVEVVVVGGAALVEGVLPVDGAVFMDVVVIANGVPLFLGGCVPAGGPAEGSAKPVDGAFITNEVPLFLGGLAEVEGPAVGSAKPCEGAFIMKDVLLFLGGSVEAPADGVIIVNGVPLFLGALVGANVDDVLILNGVPLFLSGLVEVEGPAVGSANPVDCGLIMNGVPLFLGGLVAIEGPADVEVVALIEGLATVDGMLPLLGRFFEAASTAVARGVGSVPNSSIVQGIAPFLRDAGVAIVLAPVEVLGIVEESLFGRTAFLEEPGIPRLRVPDCPVFAKDGGMIESAFVEAGRIPDGTAFGDGPAIPKALAL